MEDVVDPFLLPSEDFWKNKRVFVTGNTGFKGSWLTLWLTQLGATVKGLALPANTNPALFNYANINDLYETSYSDIRAYESTRDSILVFRPDILIHMAAQPLVRESYKDPLETFSTNIMGTANILNAARDCESVSVILVITTDKVYENREWEWPYREDDSLGGHDPYSSSKAATELIVNSYRSSYYNELGISISSARAGNVIGGGDWSIDRLIPDAIRAWLERDDPLEIRKPNSRRPWQHVLDPINGYLCLIEKMWEDASLSGAYNFGPCSERPIRVIDVIKQAQKTLGQGQIFLNEDSSSLHEATLLSLDSSKSIKNLSWYNKLSQFESITKTVDWYNSFYKDKSRARELCEGDISLFKKLK